MPVRFETEGAIAIITIDRPEVANSVDGATANALVEAFERFDADPALNVAILRGEGKNFCAGGDLKAITTGQGSIVVNREGAGPLGPSRMMLTKPVIAAVEGNAVAGGLELSLWCDMRVAAKTANFGVYCRRWGVPLCDGGTVRLPRLIGQSHALDMILTGRSVGGEEAYRMGLTNRLCETGETLETALKLARVLARLPQITMRSDRRSAYEQWDLDLPAALRNETERGLETMAAGGMAEGLSTWQARTYSLEDYQE